MRIVHVADSFAPDIGGIERQVETLATRQRNAGHDVTVITAVAEPADLDLDLDVARAASGRWLTVAFPWRNHRMVAAVLDGRPIDVVHAHFTVISPVAIYVSRAASRRGIPVAITVHSLWWQVGFATRLATLPFGWGHTRAVWSAVSGVAAGHVRRTLPRVDEVLVVPNLVDTAWWRPNEPAGSEEIDGPVRMILVGRLKKRKHIDEFIDVLADVRERVPADTKVQVNVVGEGPRRADLQGQLERRRLTDWVTLLGHRSTPDVRTLLHEADIFIAPSRQESFGIAALEARGAGLPVVGYGSTGLAEFIADGVDGVLVADAASMVDAFVELLGDREKLRRLRAAARGCPPPIGIDEATRAVEHLYARARAVLATPQSAAAR